MFQESIEYESEKKTHSFQIKAFTPLYVRNPDSADHFFLNLNKKDIVIT